MYTTHFGLREKPFNVTPDPRFYYANPVYREAYASLLAGIQERKGFIVMTGEVGTGKTTLLRMLMTNVEATVRFAYFYNTTLTFEELLTYTCDELGIAVVGEGRLKRIQALNAFLIEQLRQGGTGVLLIDEAQNLAVDALENLRLLSNLETATEKLLQIVLVGQPELEAKLAQPALRQLRQRVSVQCRLDRLKDREVGSYIRLRLETAGARRTDLFDRGAVDRLATLLERDSPADQHSVRQRAAGGLREARPGQCQRPWSRRSPPTSVSGTPPGLRRARAAARRGLVPSRRSHDTSGSDQHRAPGRPRGGARGSPPLRITAPGATPALEVAAVCLGPFRHLRGLRRRRGGDAALCPERDRPDGRGGHLPQIRARRAHRAGQPGVGSSDRATRGAGGSGGRRCRRRGDEPDRGRAGRPSGRGDEPRRAAAPHAGSARAQPGGGAFHGRTSPE